MKLTGLLATVVALSAASVSAHYRFDALIVGSSTTAPYQYIRQNTNYNSPITDVTSLDFRCNAGGLASAAATQTVAAAAGSTVGFALDQAIFHPGPINVYMAKAPGNVASFDGSGNVWFKVYEIRPVTNGRTSITWPADNISSFTFQLPSSLPSGQYLVRVEHIALHSASTFGGAQFYISCGRINVTGGGSGNPGPLVAIPGVYTGREPGIMLNIYDPIPATYTQPGPAVWRG
ncbi:family 61 glycoside hydrolase [Pleurotus eryngii]|uniref:AA9 family lytic polysaccharide monooxygenase n=1 Tax=Pleurotus eryngii TaxID=5323 RepID=A0A9P5ZUQ8_PLEER|nr:family 61 glycoside hydrolase [Pleurotus eryngii]